MADKCTAFDVDGETVIIRGSGQMTEEDQGYMAEIVRAARAKFAADRAANEGSE